MSATAPTAVLLTAFGAVGLGLLGFTAARQRRERRRARRVSRPSCGAAATVDAARRLNRAAGALAACVLSDSAVEHYRGSFHNKSMFIPLLSAGLSIAASAHGSADSTARVHGLRNGAYGLAVVAGLVGTAFHLYNIAKRPGAVSWQNLFYAAPAGAPAALGLSGLLGFAAERVRGSMPGASATVLGLPAGRALAALTSVGLLGSAAEAALLHLRGAYHNPAMWLPVGLPPIAAVALAASAVSGRPAERRKSRGWLRLTALLGFVGAGFHVYGVSRGMGGWRNWTQNLLNGPPIPAPPGFSALALAGLAALELQRTASRDD
ncbi:MAG TPA: hypothetical protein VIY90_11370 [Steroidobacteraceae bacterium]